MKTVIAHAIALVLALLCGKLIAGAISGILVSPLESAFSRFSFVTKSVLPFLQGIAMGVVAVITAEWIFRAFSLKMGWIMVCLIALGSVTISYHLMKNIEERHFHLPAGLGELFGILLAAHYYLQMAASRVHM